MNGDPIFDFHEHDDHVHRTTGYAHIHDRHPYHSHDLNGSVHYVYMAGTSPIIIELDRPADPPVFVPPSPSAAPGVVPVPRNTRQDGDDTETPDEGFWRRLATREDFDPFGLER